MWTGTDPSGSAIPLSHCKNWMGTQSDDGRIGSNSATGVDWTSVSTVRCLVPAHVYCFEIPE